MIRFSDLTINQAQGSFKKVCELMTEDIGPSNKWMIRSDATIITDVITSNFRLHLWGDGRVYIKETTHPFVNSVPDDDLRELREWCEVNGWGCPKVDGRLVADARAFDFWLNKYRAALIDSDDFRKFEEDEMKRMSEATEEKDEDFYIS